MSKDRPILEVKHLSVEFKTREGILKAVNDVSFDVNPAEMIGIVGESGCGKSVTSKAIMKLIGNRKNEFLSGKVIFKGENILEKSEKEMQKIRGRDQALISQDPMTSLNPLFKVGQQIAEVPRIHQKVAKKNAWEKAIKMLETVKVPSAGQRANQYPHQFSGGMLQRCIIAMGLSCEPELLIADEPTTALDVTIQAQVLKLIMDLKKQFGTAIILITHDLGVVAQTCDTVAVLYAGSIVEMTSKKSLFKSPRHPYTRGLLESIPNPAKKGLLNPIGGQPPNLVKLPQGCPFHPRCGLALAKCRETKPDLKNRSENHRVACWLEESHE